MTTGAAATSRFVNGFTAAATQNNTTPTKNTRRPSRSRSRSSNDVTLRMRWNYAKALYRGNRAEGATLDDLREAVTSLEDTEQTARRVLGSAHPLTGAIEANLRNARAALSAREAREI